MLTVNERTGELDPAIGRTGVDRGVFGVDLDRAVARGQLELARPSTISSLPLDEWASISPSIDSQTTAPLDVFRSSTASRGTAMTTAAPKLPGWLPSFLAVISMVSPFCNIVTCTLSRFASAVAWSNPLAILVTSTTTLSSVPRLTSIVPLNVAMMIFGAAPS